MTTQIHHQNSDYTTIKGRLKTVSLNNGSHLTGMVETGLPDPNLPNKRA